MILDASILLRAFFPDEAQEQAQRLLAAHVTGETPLHAPTLLTCEVSNAVWQAERRGRITSEQAGQILEAIDGLRIRLHPVAWDEMLVFSRRFDRSTCDAAYLALAEQLGEPFITADARLYHAVRAHLD